ncbi:MAG: glycosyltransferase family 4 protein [Steroidobacteraceae bacterium]
MTAVRAPSPGKFVFVNRFFDPDESATSQLLTDLTRDLAAAGLPVHVVCSRQLYTDAAAGLAARQMLHGVAVHRVATTRFGRSGLAGRFLDYATFYLSAGWTLLRLLDARDLVIAKTDPPFISIIAASCAWLKGARLVNWQQDVFPEVASRLAVNPLPQWLDETLCRLRDWSLRRAQTNVVLGSRMLEYFERRGIGLSQLRIIENWADPDGISPKSVAESTLRAQLRLTGKFVVCYSGNLGRAHEFETLVAAAELLRDEPSVIFLIIGGGAKMESLQRATRQQQLESFLFLPYQPRTALADSLAAGDVHLVSLLPSLEGLILPSKLYGIMAAGRPLIFIGDADGEIARVIGEAECGITAAVNDATTVAAAIIRLKLNTESRIAMGGRAREFFLDRYARDKAVKKWLVTLNASGSGSGAEPNGSG